jgi:hypothetical protein
MSHDTLSDGSVRKNSSTRRTILIWLNRLASLIAMDKPIANLQDKLGNWADMLTLENLPRNVFTKQRILRSAATHFSTGFPDYKSMVDFLQGHNDNFARERHQRETHLPPPKRINAYALRDAWMRDNSDFLDQQIPRYSDEHKSLRWWIGDDILDKALKHQPLAYSDADFRKRAAWLKANPMPKQASSFGAAVQRVRDSARRASEGIATPSPACGTPIPHDPVEAEDERWRVTVREAPGDE